MRGMRTVLVVFLAMIAPALSLAQTTPIPPDNEYDLARVMLLLDALGHVTPRQAETALKSASPSDLGKLLWVIQTKRDLESGALPSSFSPRVPPPASYTPYVPSPGYSTSLLYPAPAVITANPYLGTPINPYDPRVNQYSPTGAKNPYTTSGGKIYGSDGTYLGKLNANPYDPESVANPYGKYGSPYSPTSIKNPYSIYGSPYSSKSATNPYAVTPPRVIYGDTTRRR